MKMAEGKPNSNEITTSYEVPPVENEGDVHIIVGWRGKFNGKQYGSYINLLCLTEAQAKTGAEIIWDHMARSKEAIEKLAEKSNETP